VHAMDIQAPEQRTTPLHVDVEDKGGYWRQRIFVVIVEESSVDKERCLPLGLMCKPWHSHSPPKWIDTIDHAALNDLLRQDAAEGFADFPERICDLVAAAELDRSACMRLGGGASGIWKRESARGSAREAARGRLRDRLGNRLGGVWIGLDWIGLDCIELDWIGFD
jgi:hypothetical protein